MNVIVSDLNESQYDSVVSLLHRTIRKSFGEIYPKELVDEFCNKYSAGSLAERCISTKHWVVVGDDKVVGIIGLKDSQLRTFFVDPDHQGLGIGRKLYDTLEVYARKNECKKLVLEGSPLGKPAYEAFGFVSIGEKTKVRNGFSYTDTVMEKKLD